MPPSGYAITAMAVIAGIMALRPEMHGREKFLWFAILLAFMVVEIRAINKDRRDQNGKFETIASGLKAAIDGIQGTVNEITGGDTYPMIVAVKVPGSSTRPLSIFAVGKNNLYSLTVSVIPHVQRNDKGSMTSSLSHISSAHIDRKSVV